MSYSYTVEVYKTKVNVLNMEHSNGHGSGPAVWDYAHMKAFGTERPVMGEVNWAGMLNPEVFDDHDLACIASTYDFAYIDISDIASFACSARIVHDRIIKNTDWTWNHFKGFAEDAEALSNKHDHRCIGMAINCTSVWDSWFEPDTLKNKWSIYKTIKEARQS